MIFRVRERGRRRGDGGVVAPQNEGGNAGCPYCVHQRKKTFAIERGGKVIGSLGIEKYDEEKLPEFSDKSGRELGFVLSKSYWGNGYMAEAVRAVIDYLFRQVGLDFIACGYFTDNPQSKRVQEKCGFKFYKYSKYTTAYGVTKDECINVLFG